MPRCNVASAQMARSESARPQQINVAASIARGRSALRLNLAKTVATAMIARGGSTFRIGRTGARLRRTRRGRVLRA